MNLIAIYNIETNKRHSLELTTNELARIRQALKILEADQVMEILHDQVVNAFWEYRNKVDYWRLRSLAGIHNTALSYEVKSTLNRLAFNVLNLSKLFLDTHYHEDKSCFVFEQTGSQDKKEQVNEHRKKIYDENIRYVIGCKLRNKSQHGELPVSNFSSGFKTRKTDEKIFITFKMTLGYDDLMKLNVPKNRIDTNSKFDLTDVLDGYIYAVSTMHICNRSLTDEVVTQSKETLKEFIDRAAQNNELQSCIIDLNCPNLPPEYIGLDRFDIACHLRDKHPREIDYSRFAFDLGGF